MSAPPILIHQHIFKNAGTSFINTLKSYFGESRVMEIEPQRAHGFFTHNELEDVVNGYP